MSRLVVVFFCITYSWCLISLILRYNFVSNFRAKIVRKNKDITKVLEVNS